MFEVLKFILNCVIEFISMLFTIDIGSNMSLGLLMCVIFIFLPLVIALLNFLKYSFFDELDDRYDVKQYKRSDKK